MKFEGAVACQQIVQVTVKKPVSPDLLEQQVQKQPNVIYMGLSTRRYGEHFFDLTLKIGEYRFDNLILVVKMVVQISRADIQIVGDNRRGDIGLSEIVEQSQAGFKDAFACTSLRFDIHGPARRPVVCLLQRT